MYVSKNLSSNESGHLTIGGLDTVALAGKYGTPLYVMDEDMIRQNMRLYTASIEKYYNGNGGVAYASKAFSCKEIYRIAHSEGLWVDVVSMGELYTAMSVNFPPKMICYHGNNKTQQEIRMALEYGVAYFVVDGTDELDLLQSVAQGMGTTAGVLLRVTPGVEAHTHEFIKTGQIDSKFGMVIENGAAEDAVKKALSLPNLQLEGIHCHIGSQIFEIAPFQLASEVLLGFMAEMKGKYGCKLCTMNLGGGFGIAYTPQDDPVAYDEYMRLVSETVKRKAAELGIDVPYILIEPGRSIVGSAGITLYMVGTIKDIPDVRKYVSVDGGMTDNIRYALYQAKYEFLLANKANREKTDTVTIAGRCCESGDLLGEHVSLQRAEPGDILAVCATGAYNYSMANHYNRMPKPPVVMVSNQKSRLVVRRETLEDLLSCDL